MKKVIEILKKHEFEENVMMASRIDKNFRKHLGEITDEKCLILSAKSYIRFLLSTNKLNDNEDVIIIDEMCELLAKEVLKQLDIKEIQGEQSNHEKFITLLAAAMTSLK